MILKNEIKVFLKTIKNYKMRFKSVIIVVLSCFICPYLNAQVKISDDKTNLNTINPNAVLEIESTNKGVVPPKVSLSSFTSIAPMTGTVPEGIMVYNTSSSMGNGYYYWDGSRWRRLIHIGEYNALSNRITTLENGANDSAEEMFTIPFNTLTSGERLFGQSTGYIFDQKGAYLLTTTSRLFDGNTVTCSFILTVGYETTPGDDFGREFSASGEVNGTVSVNNGTSDITFINITPDGRLKNNVLLIITRSSGKLLMDIVNNTSVTQVKCDLELTVAKLN